MWWCVERRAAEENFHAKTSFFTVQTNFTIFNRETPSERSTERAVTGTTHTHTAPPCAQHMHMPGAHTRRDGRRDAVTNEDPSKAGSRGLW